jgi:hypothetical protein
MRRITIIAALFAVVLAVTASTASSTGVSPSELEGAGWTCIVPLPGDNIHCAPPGGLARVVAGTAETMTFLVFRPSDGEFIGSEHIVRADLFNGQPCPTDPPSRQYTYLLPLLGLDYYACHRYDSSF